MSEEIHTDGEVLMDVTNTYEVHVTTTEFEYEKLEEDERGAMEDGKLEEDDVMEDGKLVEDDRGVMESVIHSEIFREELQEMVAQQISDSLQFTAQPLYDLISLRQRYSEPDVNRKYVDGPVVPVADIRGVDTLNYSKGEKLFRCKLASCYRLMDLFGWTNGLTDGCVTARMADDSEDYILVAPSSLMCDEVTASSLAKVAVSGAVIDAGSTGLDVDPLSLSVHSALYAAARRSDIKSVMHITSTSAISMSLLKTGFLQLSPESVVVGEVAYYDRGPAVVDCVDRESIAEALGLASKVLFLRGYGILICGESIEEAYYLAFSVMSAISIQLSLLSVGSENILLPSAELCQNLHENYYSLTSCISGSRRRWRRGQLEFEAMMRQLDNAGYQTGYIYLSQADRASSEAEIAPSSGISSSLGGSDRDLTRTGSPHKVPRSLSADRRGTPNIYHQVIDKNSEPAKKITKWVPVDITPVARPVTPVSNKANKPNQFAPQGINPAELKEKIKAIRQDYFTDKVTAGPQSRILEGINWDEAQNMKDGANAGSTDAVIAVSKGVIQRDHQHTATITGHNLFQPPNPFNRMSEDDIDDYKTNVEKHSGESSELGAEGRQRCVEEETELVHSGQAALQGTEEHDASLPAQVVDLDTTDTGTA